LLIAATRRQSQHRIGRQLAVPSARTAHDEGGFRAGALLMRRRRRARRLPRWTKATRSVITCGMAPRFATPVAALTLLTALPAQNPTENAVLRWNDAALASIRTAGTNPPKASRLLAMLHTAIFDAANGINPEYHEYLVAPAAPNNSSRIAAVTTAAHEVLAAEQPSALAAFDTLHSAILASLPDDQSKTDGVNWGDAVALQILAARSNDGSTAVVAFPGSTDPGAWRPTISFGGVVRPAMLPGWGNVTPFGVADVGALQPPAPPALNTLLYALDVGYTKAYGGSNSTARHPKETESALFWGYGAGSCTPPGHWNQIATVVAQQRNLDLLESARLFALLNIAMADAAIVCWRAKYNESLWRPITAIQLDGDGNDRTTADPTWVPLLPTPPFPEYTSGHSTFSGAAAAVLRVFFDRDQCNFVVGSDDLPGVTRRYTRFSRAAIESGMSRIYGGIHFMSGNLHGLACGEHIGVEVSQLLGAL
jgi:hypothetical protein